MAMELVGGIASGVVILFAAASLLIFILSSKKYTI